MNRKNWRLALLYYGAWLAFIWPALAIYFNGPYYKTFLTDSTQNCLISLALIYTLAAPAGYWIALHRKGQIRPSRAYLAICTIKKLAVGYKGYLGNLISKPFYPQPKLEPAERTNLLFMLVKFFFLPIMLNFLFANLSAIDQGVSNINSTGVGLSLASLNHLIYPFLLSILLLIDTAYFTFGYAVEAGFLNNKVVSVDPTYLGWISAIICYPPFSGYMGNLVPWYANDNAVFNNTALTSLLYLSVLALMFVYVAASVALGAKASNLTNRGIVSRWPYSFVRHPAYITKNLAWWVTIIPIISPAAVLGMAVWSFIYFLRSITEERHLMMLDNGYKEYSQKVRWRFIPRVY